MRFPQHPAGLGEISVNKQERKRLPARLPAAWNVDFPSRSISPGAISLLSASCFILKALVLGFFVCGGRGEGKRHPGNGLPRCSKDKELACQCRRRFRPGLRRSPGEGMATPSNILVWEIPWTEEPGGPRSMGSQRVGNDLGTKQYRHHPCNSQGRFLGERFPY